MAAIVSVIPIILLFVLMMGLKMSGWKSALITLVVTILLAVLVTPSMGIVPDKYIGSSIYGITFWSIIEGILRHVSRLSLSSSVPSSATTSWLRQRRSRLSRRSLSNSPAIKACWYFCLHGVSVVCSKVWPDSVQQ